MGMASRRPRSETYLLLSTAILVALTTAIFMAQPLAAPQGKAKPNLALRVADQNGRMRIDWDASNSFVRTAQGATLEVEDGGVFNRYPVEANILRSGGLDYVRRSDDVLLTLTLYQDGRPGLQSSIRRIAPLDFQAATAPGNADRKDTSRTRRR